MPAEDLPFPPIPADAATDVRPEAWYDVILEAWRPGSTPFGNDELYRRTLNAFGPDEDDDDNDNPAHIGPVS